MLSGIEPRISVSCWKCYTESPPLGESRAFHSASNSGTLKEILEAGWKQFYWEIRPHGMDPRFWLCPEHAADPPKGSLPHD